MKQESVTLNYRPLRAGERYCPACGADTLRREPDGTVYYVGHSEANCYRRQLFRAHAEADHYRQRYEALREAVVEAADAIGNSAERAWKASDLSAGSFDEGRAHGLEEAEDTVRLVLEQHKPEVADDAVAR